MTIDASLGNVTPQVFNVVKSDELRFIGQIFIIVNVIAFNFILFNLIIAILANTYELFDLGSNGLYLS